MKRTKMLVATGIAAVTIGFAAALPAAAHGPGRDSTDQHQGWYDGWHMGRGMMGPGMMDYGMPGPRMNGPHMMAPLRQDLTAADVQHMMEHRLTWGGNPHIKLGKVEEQDDDTITVEIVTREGSLVDKLAVDRHTGYMQPVR